MASGLERGKISVDGPAAEETPLDVLNPSRALATSPAILEDVGCGQKAAQIIWIFSKRTDVPRLFRSSSFDGLVTGTTEKYLRIAVFSENGPQSMLTSLD